MGEAPVRTLPVVSVVIPCFNSERWLGEAIASVLAQTHRAVETIVVDDGSTDGSIGLVERFADRVRLARQERRGAGAARNRGLALATGDYVKFLDSDDTLMPDCIERQVRSFAEFAGQRVAIFGRSVRVDEDGRILPDRGPRAEDGHVGVDWVIANLINTSSPLYRRSDLQTITGFDETLPAGQEYDLNVRLAIDGLRFVYRDLVIYRFRQHMTATRLTMQAAGKVFPARLASTERHLRRLEETRGRPLPLELRSALAHHVWSLGRGASRGGLADVARSCFARAREICPEDPIAGTLRYRLASGFLSPTTLERLSMTYHALKGTR